MSRDYLGILGALQNVAESKNKKPEEEKTYCDFHFLGTLLGPRIHTHIYDPIQTPNKYIMCIALSMLINYNKDSSLFNFTISATINIHYQLICVVESGK